MVTTTPELDEGTRPPTGTARRRWVRAAAVGLTATSVLQQALLAAGVGGWIPGWLAPSPLLLLAAAAWLYLWPWTPPVATLARLTGALRRIPVPAYLLGVLAVALAVWSALQDAEPWFGHEEAVYANKARSWLTGLPAGGWDIFRPVGLPALGYLALVLHDLTTGGPAGVEDGVGGVGALRLVGLLLLLGMLAVTSVVAARWTSPRQSIVVLLLLLSGLGFLRRTPQLLNDIGATGLLLVVVYLLARSQESRGPRGGSPGLLVVPVLALAAFYLRYGVAGNLVAIAAAAVIAYGPRAWLAHARELVTAGAIFLAGIVPHLAHSVEVTGSPLGLILVATDKANRTFVGDGLLYYLAILPYRLAGDLGGVVLIAGLVGSAFAARRLLRRQARPADRRTVFCGVAGVLLMVVLGLATDGEPRFIFLSLVLLTIVGVQTLAAALHAWSGPLLAGIGALAVLTVPATYHIVADIWLPPVMADRLSTVAVARDLGAERDPDQGCLIVTGYVPEMSWYSGCDAVRFREAARMRLPTDRPVHFVFFDHGRLQPGIGSVRAGLDDRPVIEVDVRPPGTLGHATVLTALPSPAYP